MSQPKLKVTTLAVSIHADGVNPIFGEGAIKVRLEDESAGPFIVLSGDKDDEEGSIRIDLEELQLAALEAAKLIAAYPDK